MGYLESSIQNAEYLNYYYLKYNIPFKKTENTRMQIVSNAMTDNGYLPSFTINNIYNLRPSPRTHVNTLKPKNENNKTKLFNKFYFIYLPISITICSFEWWYWWYNNNKINANFIFMWHHQIRYNIRCTIIQYQFAQRLCE